MRRLQIMIDEDLDHALEVRARREGTSKAALLRAAARDRYLPTEPADDPLAGMVGVDDSGPLAPGESIDDVVYR
jgi:Ribbon-helix-helix protein, copG family